MLRRGSVGIAASGVVALVTALILAGSPPIAAASGSSSGPGPAPISFLHRTKALRKVGSTVAAAQTASSGGSGFDPLESAHLREIYAHEQELGPEVEPTSALPNPKSLPLGAGEGLKTNFDGLNHFQERYSDGGNQLSAEPPDQALCVSNKYVVENVNSVLQVYTPSGEALLPGQPGVPNAGPVGVSVNQFFGLASSIDRTNLVFGPFVSDPVCLYDAADQRWYVTTLENDLDPNTGAFSGPSETLIAVSRTANPLGQWDVWAINTTNNGQNGTPDHHCSSGYCFADFPQIGIDRNGLYVTANEFDNIGNNEFHGAQLVAISKHDLVTGVHVPASQYFENVQSSSAGDVAYTLLPANALPQDWDWRDNGTMYFGESLSPYFGGDITNQVALFALSNTRSLDSGSPDLQLQETAIDSEDYASPAHSLQRPGPTPLLHCVNIGKPCIGVNYPHQDGPVPLDSGPGKFGGAWLHDGIVYLVTGTEMQGSGGAADFDGSNGQWAPIDGERAGIAYFGVRPQPSHGVLSATMAQQGYVAVDNANLIWPSVAVAPSGEGVIGATLVGPRTYPSAAYTTFQASSSFRHHGDGAPRSVQVAGPGVGPYDGDSGTWDGGLRPRWGDYSYSLAAPDGSLWVATEYVNQRCGFAQFAGDTTCGNTRTFYANWGTRVMQVKGSH